MFPLQRRLRVATIASLLMPCAKNEHRVSSVLFWKELPAIWYLPKQPLPDSAPPQLCMTADWIVRQTLQLQRVRTT